MEIADWRKKIDEIDRNLVRLLNERAVCVLEIGKIKRSGGLPIVEQSREEEVLRRVVESNQGPLDNETVRRLIEAVMRESKGLQQKLFDENNPPSAKLPKS